MAQSPRLMMANNLRRPRALWAVPPPLFLPGLLQLPSRAAGGLGPQDWEQQWGPSWDQRGERRSTRYRKHTESEF